MEIDPQVNSHLWPLSTFGRSQAGQLAGQLAVFEPQIVITSQELKALQTGQTMGAIWQVPVKAAPGLQENDRRGTPFFSTQAEFNATVQRFFRHPTKLVWGQETAVQAQERFSSAVHTQLALNKNQNVALVAHGVVLTLFVWKNCPDQDPFKFWNRLTQPCALIFDPKTLKLLRKIDG